MIMIQWLISNWRVISILFAAGVLFCSGWYVCSLRYEARMRAVLESKINEYEALDRIRQAQAEHLENQLRIARKKSEVRYVERQKIVEKPVYRECHIDADGLRLIADRATEINASIGSAYAVR